MNTFLILVAIIVGVLIGYKYGKTKGLDESWVAISKADVMEILKGTKDMTNEEHLVLDRDGWEILSPEENSEN